MAGSARVTEFVGACWCDWRGPRRAKAEDAEADAKEHADATGHVPPDRID